MENSSKTILGAILGVLVLGGTYVLGRDIGYQSASAVAASASAASLSASVASLSASMSASGMAASPTKPNSPAAPAPAPQK